MQVFRVSQQDPKQFSFHRSPLDSSNRHNTSSGQSIKTTLLKLPHHTLVQICLDSLDQNQYLKSQHYKITNQSISYKSQLSEINAKMEKKRETIRVLVQNHNKLTQMFERHMKMCNREDIKPEEYWEKKYRELEHYMNQYVMQSNEVQEEYLKSYNRLKDENQRVYIQVGGVNQRVRELEVRLMGEGGGGQGQGEYGVGDGRLREMDSNTLYSNHFYSIQKPNRQSQKLNQQRQQLQSDITLLHNDLQGFRERIKVLEIENMSLKAQIYLRNPSSQCRQDVGESRQENRVGHNGRKKHILIPPLKIQQSLQKIKLIQRSHSAAYL